MSRTITFDTGLDIKTLAKDLDKAKKAVGSIEDRIGKKQIRQDRLVKDLERANYEAAKAEQKLKALQNMSNAQKKDIYMSGGDPNAMIAQQAAVVQQTQKAADKAAAAVAKIDDQIADENVLLTQANEKVAEQEALFEQAKRPVNALTKAGDAITGTLDEVTRRVKGLMKRVLFFSVITAGLRHLRSYFSDVIQQNAQASQAIANMKNAFATLAQPLIQAVIPAVITLANWITKVVTAIAQLIALVTGKKLKDFQKAAKKGAGGGGGGGNDKSLAGFDTLNQLSGGGGGGGAAAEMEQVAELGELTEGEMAGILAAVGLIGAALAAWKLPFGGNLSFFEKFIGILLLVGGTILAVKGYMDAWNKGANLSNVTKILVGVAAAITGLYVLFGPMAAAIGAVVAGIAVLVLGFKDVLDYGANFYNLGLIVAGVALVMGGLYVALGSVAAGIAGVVAGIAIIILAFHDMMENGVTLENTVLLIIGTIVTALGIFFLTGANNPLIIIIGLIAALVLAAVAAGGEMEGLISGIKLILDGLIKFIKGVFTGDWEMAWEGVKDIFKGIFNTVLAIFGGVINAIIKGINWLINKVNEKIGDGLFAKGLEFVTGGKFSKIPTIQSWTVPYLASGAVIPPNREFLAVLGDQSAGTNIEAPLETIVEAFQRVAGNQNINIQFTGDLAQLARVLNPYIKRDSRQAGVSLVEG